MAENKDHFIYSGTLLRKTVEIVRSPENIEIIHPYIPNTSLVDAVNLAILLEKPLLVMGEPGCGKSKLAQAIAYELHHQEDYQNYYYEWHIKSNTNAKEGLYNYDAIQRLGDAQILKNDEDRSTLDKENYVKDGPLGLAIQQSTPQKKAVLLIDEIDKADLDFPNDLLNELDKGEYIIPELRKSIKAKAKPIVIITSNQEKELPDAFLRRCIYHYIEPLEPKLLQDILERRFYNDSEGDANLIERTVKKFIQIRKELKEKKLMLGKNVSTSELIDWFEVIKYYNQYLQERNKLQANGQDQTAELKQLKSLLDQLEAFNQNKAAIPFQQVLFKNYNTLLNFRD